MVGSKEFFKRVRKIKFGNNIFFKTRPLMFWLIELGDIAAHNRAKVFGAETSPQLLEELLVKFKDHHQSVQTLLLKQEYQRSQAMMRQKMLENLDESLKKQTQVH